MCRYENILRTNPSSLEHLRSIKDVFQLHFDHVLRTGPHAVGATPASIQPASACAAHEFSKKKKKGYEPPAHDTNSSTAPRLCSPALRAGGDSAAVSRSRLQQTATRCPQLPSTLPVEPAEGLVDTAGRASLAAFMTHSPGVQLPRQKAEPGLVSQSTHSPSCGGTVERSRGRQAESREVPLLGTTECNLSQRQCPVLGCAFKSARCIALVPCGHVVSLKYVSPHSSPPFRQRGAAAILCSSSSQ
jgi:hypothetical protein